MNLFAPNALETHLIAEHGVRPELIARSREQLDYGTLAMTSHDLLHKLAGEMTGHTHNTSKDTA